MRKKGTAIIGFMLLLVLLLIEIAPAPVAAGADWVGRFNAAASGEDSATAIAVDPSGNVYVTGYCDWGATGDDYVTRKYNVLGGLLQSERYDGTGHSEDVATAVAVHGTNRGRVLVQAPQGPIS